MFSLGWSFSMPSKITGLLGSCLVIPCSFDYKSSLPSDLRVRWYQYETEGHSVYDRENPQSVIDVFRGKTDLYGSPEQKSCSLKISSLVRSHHRRRLYTWVDPKPISQFHKHNFQDTTVELDVTDRADSPEILIDGKPKVGQQLSVQCSVYHTCPSTPPTLRLNGPTGTDKVTNTEAQDSKWKATLVRTWAVAQKQQSVTCDVTHPGGLTASASKTITAECSVGKLTINPQSEEFLEGVEKSVTCSVTYTCHEDQPTLEWNYRNMVTSSTTKSMGVGSLQTQSTLMFKAAGDDHSKALMCTAKTASGESQEAIITLQVKRSMLSLGWSFSTPRRITGLLGSCLVIPCSFDYKSSLPSDLRVRWYQYASKGYPLVYDRGNPGSVIDVFRGKTDLYGSPAEKSCSLKISSLVRSHHGERLYTWVDPNPVSSFHGHNFQDKTVELHVTDRADNPEILIDGIPKVGQQINIQCSVYHTCPSTPPTLKLSGPSGKDTVTETVLHDGKWKTTLVRTWVVGEDDQTVSCTVQHPGGLTATAETTIQAECPIGEITIDPKPEEFQEGVVKNITCSISYICRKQQPIITWNYKEMQAFSSTTKGAEKKWETESIVMFIASIDDHEKKLTCTAQFPDGKRPESSIKIRVKKFEARAGLVPGVKGTSHLGTADVLPRINALTRSCVVIPCAFQLPGNRPVTGLGGIWHKLDGGYAYHNGQSRVLDNFKGRTRLLGEVDEQNCTLEIDDIKAHDNGPFCFRAEKETDTYDFNNSCVFIIMKASPNKPVMTALPQEIEEGSSVSVTCSVTHTCPSHPPTFTWNVIDMQTTVSHVHKGDGVWETSSTLTFAPSGNNYENYLNCSAIFWKGKRQETIASLNVKRKMNFLPILLPVSVGVPVALSLCVVVLIWKKCSVGKCVSQTPERPPRPEKRRSLWQRFSRRQGECGATWINDGKGDYRGRPIDYQTKPPRPEKRRSIWSRFSRRNPGDFQERPPRPEKRMSIWNRFSRRTQGYTADMNVGSRVNNETMTIATQNVSKPRCPSPKSNLKSAHPAKRRNDFGYNVDDGNIYGNM
ncbi:hypothetical protein MATL_G00126390 [Megalops atlanticus]|uniref:Ig-like domain-containing protein n=1 Tax=Megalops atlanticus TaxID=7932 RepID=A0A9D3PUP1_MEGAT|nr:hypothetical protein MATL_G00126390 [Megalops atlanticus]